MFSVASFFKMPKRYPVHFYLTTIRECFITIEITKNVSALAFFFIHLLFRNEEICTRLSRHPFPFLVDDLLRAPHPSYGDFESLPIFTEFASRTIYPVPGFSSFLSFGVFSAMPSPLLFWLIKV